jgi:hypothetical protein
MLSRIFLSFLCFHSPLVFPSLTLAWAAQMAGQQQLGARVQGQRDWTWGVE